MLTVVLQVWPWLRRHHPKVHRCSGGWTALRGREIPAPVVDTIRA
jgi:hypothetical protein